MLESQKKSKKSKKLQTSQDFERSESQESGNKNGGAQLHGANRFRNRLHLDPHLPNAECHRLEPQPCMSMPVSHSLYRHWAP